MSVNESCGGGGGWRGKTSSAYAALPGEMALRVSTEIVVEFFMKCHYILWQWIETGLQLISFFQLLTSKNKDRNYHFSLFQGIYFCFQISRYSEWLWVGRSDDRVRFPAGAGNFSLRHRIKTGSGAHPASCPTGTGALSLGVNQPGREADHSHIVPRTKNAWS
jgi:hypothetical protein